MVDALKGQSERDGYLLQQHGINVGEKEAGGAVDRVQYYTVVLISLHEFLFNVTHQSV